MGNLRIGAIGSEETNNVKNPLDRYKKYLPQKTGGRKLNATWFADHLREANAGYIAPANGNNWGATAK